MSSSALVYEKGATASYYTHPASPQHGALDSHNIQHTLPQHIPDI